jgi:hypothetical protein
MKNRVIVQIIALVLFAISITGCTNSAAISADAPPRWWKGNTHTHTFWSDGGDYPEMVAAWYKDHGYHFLTLSDHNVLSQGQRWTQINKRHTETGVYQKYLNRFGADWVQTRQHEGKEQIRLKPLNEFRHLLEVPGQFMLVQGEELTAKKAHVNAINTIERLGRIDGETAIETLQNNINAVLEQEQRTGQQMLPHANHPNWRWDLQAEDLIPLVGEQFFELYNGGGTSCNNVGDDNHISTERMWDVILAMRLGVLDLPVMYGVGTDDSHVYHETGPTLAPPGRGWLMVRSTHLTPEYIIEAMEAGDFYASNGLTLKDIQFDGKTLTVTIDKELGVDYTTRFIGTRKGFAPDTTEQTHKDGDKDHTVKIYSDQIGVILKEVQGTTASYTLSGDELYVRATVVSDKLKKDPHVIGELETAWVQPVTAATGQ